MYVSALSLSNFRSYAALHLRDVPPGLVAFTGANGAGKTNILEGLSLLAPGRGLRSAHDDDIQNKSSPDTPWAVHARLNGKYGPQEIGLGHDALKKRRIVHLNGEKLKSNEERAEIFRCVWLTPREDRLFLDGASARRKWLDRFVFTADAAHAGRITRLDRLLAERNRLLSLDRVDPLWLNAIEDDLAATSLAVATARVDYLDRLRSEIPKTDPYLFPAPSLRLHGFFEERVGQEPALQIETDYRRALERNRAHDRTVQATTIGPHRSDIVVSYTAKDMPARECSTGEQKALLFSLFMAHVRLITREMGEAPVLLLDEIAAHLDPDRRIFLLSHLTDLGAQVFMTATTDDAFQNVQDVALYHVNQGSVRPLSDAPLSAPSLKVLSA